MPSRRRPASSCSAPKGADWDKALAWWKSLATDPGAKFDKSIVISAADVPPTVTWGINPGQSCGVDEPIPRPADVPDADRPGFAEAVAFMKL